MNWNFNIAEAPKGTEITRSTQRKDGKTVFFDVVEHDHIIVATKCGKVTKSYWVAGENRWCMLAKNEQPVAWMPWPDYPKEETANV